MTPGPCFSVRLFTARRGEPGHRRGEYTPKNFRMVKVSLRSLQGKTAGEEFPFFAAVFLHELGEARKVCARGCVVARRAAGAPILF